MSQRARISLSGTDPTMVDGVCNQIKGISQKTKPGQTLTVDLQAGTVTIEDTGETLPCEQLGEQAMKILEAGGIKPMMRARFGK